MPLPPPSKLDSAQVLQHAFDDSTHALRTTTEATVVAGAIEVALDHSNDSIKIGDGSRLVSVAEDNSLKVSGGLIKDAYDYFSGAHTATTSVYTYRIGGASGGIVGTVTIVYVDSSKSEIQSLSVS